MNVVKNTFEDIIQYIKNKLFSSKYVVRGKCKQCGQCCKTILFSDENGYIKSEESFIALTELRYEYFKAKGETAQAEKYKARFEELKKEYSL